MKKLLPFLLGWLLASSAPAVWALNAGDIAFTHFNADNDTFAFVALVPLPASQVIRFTDTEWNGLVNGAGGGFNGGESDATWTAPALGLPAGTVVVLSPGSTASAGSVSGSLSLNDDEDSIYAYEGPGVRAVVRFLAFITNHNDASPDSIANTGLTAGTTALYLTNTADHGAYTGPRDTQTSFAAYRPLIANLATHWQTLVGGDQSGLSANAAPFTLFNPQAPVLTVSSASATKFGLPSVAGGSLSGVIGDPSDPVATLGITFAVTDQQTPGTLTLHANSSNPAVVPEANLVVTGSGATRTLTITPVAVGFTTIEVFLLDPNLNSDTYVIAFAASAGSSTPALTHYHTGAADASAAFRAGGLLYVADDEGQVIRQYDATVSGPPLAAQDFNVNLALAKEADLEACFREGDRIYWLGSQGNDNSGDIEPTRHTSFATDLVGGSLVFVRSYTGLRSALLTWDQNNGHGLGAHALGFVAGAAAGVTATDPGGFNIEGVARTADGTVWLGFRAPLRPAPALQDGRALLVPVTGFQSVVSTGNGSLQFGAPVFLDLGGRAIRSLHDYGPTGFLLMAGPVGDGGPSFEFFYWNGDPASAPQLLPSRLHAIALEAGASPESIVEIFDAHLPQPQVEVLLDGGDTVLYADGVAAKTHRTAWKKFRRDLVPLPSPFVVTTAADAGPGSLRQVMADAPAGTSVSFDPSLSGQTITLTSGHLALAKALILDASALPAGLTIAGNNTSRLFLVTLPGELHLTSVTLRDGTADVGGAIYNQGGTLLLERCSLLANTADFGGAIYSDTDLSGQTTLLLNCTLTGNTAFTRGGALYNFDGRTELIHCTIVGNTAPLGFGGGVLTYGDAATVTFVRASILSDNSGGDADLVTSDLAFSFTSLGANLVGTGEALATFDEPHDLVGVDPLLSPLGAHGGPTSTLAPRLGSPAINPGDPILYLLTDQRGAPRDSLPDRGAVEHQPAIVTHPADLGDGSLREVLNREFTTAVTFDPAFFNGEPGDTIQLTSDLPIEKPITIDASAIPGGVTISGEFATRHFFVAPTGTLHLAHLTLLRGAADVGSAIYSMGALSATDCTFTLNQASNLAALFLGDGRADFLRCTISGNTGSAAGGAWQQGDATVSSFTNCTIAANRGQNTASVGGVAVLAGTLQLLHTTVTGNTGDGIGGGLFVMAPGQLGLAHSIIAGNEDLTYPEDDIYRPSGTLLVTGPSLLGNHASVEAEFPAGALAGTAAAPLAPLLAPLGRYASATATQPPLPGSPAVEAALGSTLLTDQRGAPRPNGPQADLGAVEAVALSTLGLISEDGDTIPDLLEGPAPGTPYAHLSLFADDTALDTDGDGATDADEIASATNPLDPRSSFRVTYFAINEFRPDGQHRFTLEFTSFPGLSYAFDFSASLTAPPTRTVTLGTATDFLSGYGNLHFAPTERFIRVRRLAP